jgi:hypothetical protein
VNVETGAARMHYIHRLPSNQSPPPAWGPHRNRTLDNVLRGRYRPVAPMGVIEAPRVQLTNGLFRTIEKSTSLPTAAAE